MDGVRALLDEIRLEVLLGDGTRLVVLADPLGPVDPLAEGEAAAGGRDGSRPGRPNEERPMVRPGEIRLADEPIQLAPGRERLSLRVENSSRRVVRVSSHYPFERTNARLVFDRGLAAGFRLDIPAGESVRWAPGEVREVDLVRYGGRIGAVSASGERRDGQR